MYATVLEIWFHLKAQTIARGLICGIQILPQLTNKKQLVSGKYKNSLVEY